MIHAKSRTRLIHSDLLCNHNGVRACKCSQRDRVERACASWYDNPAPAAADPTAKHVMLPLSEREPWPGVDDSWHRRCMRCKPKVCTHAGIQSRDSGTDGESRQCTSGCWTMTRTWNDKSPAPFQQCSDQRLRCILSVWDREPVCKIPKAQPHHRNGIFLH